MTTDKGISRRIKQHIIAKDHTFFAITQPGFEKTAESELADSGISAIRGAVTGGIEFASRLTDCYLLHLRSRTLTRILMRIAHFKATNFTVLRKKTASLPWELYLSNGIQFSCKTTCHHSRLYHTGRIEQEVSDAVTARLGEYGIRAHHTMSDTESPVQTIFIRFDNDLCQISLDVSGDPLYRRGYRPCVSAAPLRETLAALILMEARIGSYDTLIDPMAGSGIFSIEAAMMRGNIHPGINRHFIFESWPSFRPETFHHIKKQLLHGAGDDINPLTVYCSDYSGQAIQTILKNLQAGKLSDIIKPEQRNFFSDYITLPGKCRSLIVLNPPYGKRVTGSQSQKKLYEKIGDTIRCRYPKSGYAIIVPGVEYEKHLGLQYDRKIPFLYGGLQVAVIFKDSPQL
ncbi:MAG TPA: hypothetical protein PKX12_01615 [Spirochaetota bacterium]|nr:hypothetical protein [Spirochaetota bacterium]